MEQPLLFKRKLSRAKHCSLSSVVQCTKFDYRGGLPFILIYQARFSEAWQRCRPGNGRELFTRGIKFRSLSRP